MIKKFLIFSMSFLTGFLCAADRESKTPLLDINESEPGASSLLRYANGTTWASVEPNPKGLVSLGEKSVIEIDHYTYKNRYDRTFKVGNITRDVRVLDVKKFLASTEALIEWQHLDMYAEDPVPSCLENFFCCVRPMPQKLKNEDKVRSINTSYYQKPVKFFIRTNKGVN